MYRIDLSHPTPQFRRNAILRLDGDWKLNGRPIRVPYPPQAPLSGWQGEVPDALYYQTSFTLPDSWLPSGHRLILHFGAVDQVAHVFINGKPAVQHEGGYLPFQADITPLIHEQENTLDVVVMDSLSHVYPWGKQSKKPKGMWYTAFSGIWQSVWLEDVPRKRIRSLLVDPSLDWVTVTVKADSHKLTALVLTPEGETLTFPLTEGKKCTLSIPAPRHWSPEDPALYGLTIRTPEDTVESYFALRTISIGKDAKGIQRLQLNGKPVFLSGLLDQGYFPDGLCLPSSPEIYAEDVARLTRLGFNCDRKHVKVEPEAFYCACDAAGVLVIQDMVNSGAYNYIFDTALPNLGFRRRPDHLPGHSLRREFFVRHCVETIEHLRNHPCIIGWTIFNEGWGQFDTTRIYRRLKGADPRRFFNSTSGWFIGHETDVDSTHVYFRNRKLRPKERPLLLAECGGFSRAVEGHAVEPKNQYGYGIADSEDALTSRMESLARDMVLPAIPKGLCGMIYTQLTDVENEINGLYTYDRQVCKCSKERLRTLNASLQEALREAVS